MPVGPDFQDPQPVPEQFPYIHLVSGDRPPETTVPLNTTSPVTFTIGVRDANLLDTLTGMWVANYPSYTKNSTSIIQYPTIGMRDKNDSGGLAVFTTTPGFICSQFMPAADHSLAFIVSDRGFSADALANPDTSKVYPYNIDENGKDIPLMVGWKISGCP